MSPFTYPSLRALRIDADLPGPSRRITVEPVRAPAPPVEAPEPAPIEEPAHAPEREPAPAR